MKVFKMTPTKQPTLKDLGYCFNRDLVLVDRFKGSRFKFMNQRDYEVLGAAITEDVYLRLEELGLRMVKLSRSRSSFFFANREVVKKSAPKILILIHGNGVVRAGQWARKIIINDGLKEGSQLEFIQKANEEGYAVIVTNTNQDVEYTSKEDHATLVWEQLIKDSPCEHVVIIAHSYGGQVTMELAKRFPEDFLTKVKGIYLTDSAHHGITSKREVKRRLADISLNFVTSTAPLNTPVSSAGDIRCVSAGTTSHDWTSFCAFHSIFDEIRHLDRGFGQNVAFDQTRRIGRHTESVDEGCNSVQTSTDQNSRKAKGHSDGFCKERKVEVRDLQGLSIGVGYGSPFEVDPGNEGFGKARHVVETEGKLRGPGQTKNQK